MASTSSCNTGCQPEIEHTNASEGIFPSPSTSATPSVGTLFSSCFSWCSLFLSLCSTQSNSMASTSTTSSQPENEVTNAFQALTPSLSTYHASSSQMRGLPYDVFISHHVPDVKHTIATTLYELLNSMGLRVFLDSEELELGDFLPRELEAAMSSASIHIAIFSENYAQSPWCLAELSFMLKTGTTIVPVFYHVQPEDVRFGKGVYGHTFSEHEEKGRYTPEKFQEWKNALNNVSYNVGHIVHNKDEEDRLLKNILHCVLKKIKRVPFVVTEHPVGLDEVVKDFELITLESAKSHQNAQIVGIWGIGGSGKTTLTKKLYNNIYPSIEKSSFILDVKEAASKSLLHKKQKKLLQDLGFKGVPVDTIEDGKAILASQLRSIRAFIVLDDVDHIDQLNALLPHKDSLGSGSLIGSGTLIVVTTREFEVLRSWGICSIYKMRALNPFYAKQLFCWHAFLQPFPRDGFEELVKKFLEACNGLPLSLKVLGGQLYGNSNKDHWETQLDKISRILPKDIKQRLKVSYDDLDDEDKEIFLDTACFFIGEKKSLAIAIWDGSGWSGLHSWERLQSKCLLELDDSDCIKMHDHLRDLGREIADQQSPHRLWFPGQLIKVHDEAQRIGIRGLMVTRTGCTSEVEFPPCSQGRELIVNTNRGSCSLPPSLLGLKIFHLRGNYYNEVIGDMSRELVWLRWFDIEQNNLGSLGSFKNLRVLEFYEKELSEHHLEELWESDSDAPLQLRELVISECYNFHKFPESIGCLGDLKSIVLSNRFWNKMRSLPEEFCLLQSLEHLELSGCRELSSLPSSFGHLRNLRHLVLSNCEGLRSLPVSFKELTVLQHLQLSGCRELSSLPSSFGHLRNLRHLDLSNCEELRSLPASFVELILLQHLNLQGCSKLTLESDILENMTKLEYLKLSNCEQLEELPLHITNQASLRELYLGGISGLRELPMYISQLIKLQVMKIGSELLTSLPTSLGDLSSLTALTIEECPKLECIPDSLGRLNLLEHLDISNSGLKSLPKSVRQLNNLQRLDIDGCPISQLDLQAGPFAFSLCNLKLINLLRTEVSTISIPQDCCPGLETLHLYWNKHLTEIEVLPSTVKTIILYSCKMLRSIMGIDGLVNIQTLKITGCPELDALPSFAKLASLQEFELQGCYGVKKIQGLEHCRALAELTAETKWEEAGIESLERMERLRIVHFTAISRSAVEGCIQSMQKWPHEIIICTRAVPDAGSLVNFVFSNLSGVFIDSDDNRKIKYNAHGVLVCFVVNCESPKTELSLLGDNVVISRTEVEKGKWVWIALFGQGSRWHAAKEYRIDPLPLSFSSLSERTTTEEFTKSTVPPYKVERAFVARGELESPVEVFNCLWELLILFHWYNTGILSRLAAVK